ncbi:SIR2 family protein [Roseivirga pacifica]|uniref:SIR2 family protein n=1 Tax=Roseivirga pacifica TaxID=1267423 RepID=UPI003BAC46A5
MQLDELRNELKTKERGISDLVRFISTRSEDNPNYSLFLGAGTSITSSVESATRLISSWKREIYNAAHPEKEKVSETEIQEFLESSVNSSWYNKRNEYSALFEKRYDLPRQRRMFIEKQVGEKIPALGYAYLINLIKHKYFKTVFTTNFDDLLNEAFYRYSDERPIVCAHDSSISSITVTSKRPKIIKLHGDYLFDDIKSTLRETESLEDNIRNKFIEFSKDYGLIIVGYSGNDRSILDVLFYLLKQDEYFKNGIYWCFRKDSVINEDVKKLLWKDRVYYVEIDGFDELMAELNNNLNKGELPIERSIISNRQNQFIDSLTENQYLSNSKSSVIQKDLGRLKEVKEEEVLTNFLQSIKPPDNNEQDSKSDLKFRPKGEKEEKEISMEEKMRLLQLYEMFRSNRYEQVLQKISKQLHPEASKKLIKELRLLSIDCHIALNDLDSAKKELDHLIINEKRNIGFFHKLIQIEDDYNRSIELIDQALEVDPHFSRTYFLRANKKYKDFKENILSTLSLDEVIEDLKTSINKDPSISNESYQLKAQVFKDKFQDKKEYIIKLQELINDIKKQDPLSPLSTELEADLMEKNNKKHDEIVDFIIYNLENQYGYSDKDYLLKLIKVHINFDKKEDAKKLFETIERDYEVDDEFWEVRSEFELEQFNNLDLAIAYIKEAIVLDNSNNKKRVLFKLLLYKKDFEEANELLNNIHGDKEYLICELHEAKEEFDEALKSVEKRLEKSPNSSSLLVQRAFLNIKLGNYEDAHKLCKDALIPNNYSKPIFVLNYELATKLKGGNINKDRLHKVLSHPETSTIETAAAYYLLGEKSKFYKKLEEALRKKGSLRYEIPSWLMFSEYKTEKKFQTLLQA